MKIFFKEAEIVCHSSWVNFWQEDTKKMLADIQSKIKDDFTPSAEKVLRFFTLDLKKAKVVILGQDPYPQKNVATGRAFEVSNVRDWKNTQINPSLKNIVKLLHKIKFKFQKASPIGVVRRDIINEEFLIAPPNELFEKWERQGVLLINTALTCAEGNSKKSNSHSQFWHSFAKKVLAYISNENHDLIWFLWGSHAQSFARQAKIKGQLLKSDHPRLYKQNPNSFLAKCHFATVNHIDWLSFS